MMSQKTPTIAARVKKLLLIVFSVFLLYAAGMLALPAFIMNSSTPNAALVRTYNAVYAPVESVMRDVPIFGPGWAAYIQFLCDATDYSCDSGDWAP
jgi:hypothetical protein